LSKMVCSIPRYIMLSRLYITDKKVFNQLTFDIMDRNDHVGCGIHGINDVGNRVERVRIVSI